MKAVFILWASMILFVCPTTHLYGQKSAHEAKQGVMDLSTWNPQETIPLSGEWRFFWQLQETPAEIASGNFLNKPFDIIKTPSLSWAESSNGKYPLTGYATYILELKGLDTTKGELALSFSQFLYNYVAYIYTPQTSSVQKIASVGVLGRSRDETIPYGVKTWVALPELTGDRAFLILQVSYFHGAGGMGAVPELGRAQNVFAKETRTLWESFFILGMFALLVITNISLFVLRSEDIPSLLMGLFSAVMGLRYFATEWLIGRFMPDPSLLGFFVNFYTLAYALPVGMCLYLMFFAKTFSGQMPRWIIPLAWIACSAFVITSLYAQFVNPKFPSIYNQVMLLMLGLGGFAFYKLIRMTFKKVRGAFLSLLGIMVIVGAMTNDVLVWFKAYDFIFLGHYGMVTFIFTQSLVVASNFAQAFRTAERLSSDLKLEVERQTRDVKTILNHIHQGIFTVRKGLTVGDDYSRYLKEILGKDHIESVDVDSLLLEGSDLNAEQKSMVHSILESSIDESSLNFEVNQDNLPKEFTYRTPTNKEKNILIDWEPVINTKSDNIDKILVTLRDVTELKLMEQKNQKNQRDMELIAEIIEVPIDRFEQFMQSAKNFLKENRRLIESSPALSTESLKIIFINYHTMKGAARTYRFKSMTSAIHNAEHTVAAAQKGESSWQKEKAVQELQLVEAVFHEYEFIHREKLKRGDSKGVIKIDLEQVKENISALASIGTLNLDERLTPFVDCVRRTFFQLYYVEVDSLLKEICQPLPQLAKDLAKLEPKVVIEPSSVGLTKEAADAVSNAFVHILRNMMDHGIEAPMERRAAGKSEVGTIRIKTTLQADGWLAIQVYDDGRGIRLDRIASIAKERGLLEKIEHLPPHDIAELIFLPGFSTSQGITEVSGRGVGMSAVRDYIEKEGGRVELQFLEEVMELRPVHFAIDLLLSPRSFTSPLREAHAA